MRLSVLSLAAACALAACTGGQSAVQPAQTGPNPQTAGVLQFRVGTANVAGTLGLNTVVTFRSPQGSSAAAVDTPTITGPAGFVVPANAPNAGGDAGTNHISGSPQTTKTPIATTFGTAGGAFAYGFAPANIDQSGAANYPQNGSAFPIAAFGVDANGNPTTGVMNVYTQPIYGNPSTALPYLVAPPASPNIYNGTYPSGYLGFSPGFITFAVPPAAGVYSLTVILQGSSGQTAATYQASTQPLDVTKRLGTFSAPVFTETPGGGGTVAYTLPSGVSHALIEAADISPGPPASPATVTLYTQAVTSSGTWTIPATLGPNGTPFASGDGVVVYAAGFDYDPLAYGPPANTQQAPSLPAQMDVTLSAPSAITTY